MDDFRTEYDFRLPLGYVDEEGRRHREGRMRLATAADELRPMQDPRVRKNPAYASVIILSQVVVRLGEVEMITPRVIENLFAADFARLNQLYDQINAPQAQLLQVTCPACKAEFETEAPPPMGES